MQQEIILTLGSDWRVSCSCRRMARQQENDASTLLIPIDASLLDKRLFLDMKLPDGTCVRTAQLTPDESGTASYNVPGAVTALSGALQMQLVFEDTDGTVCKSEIFALEVSGSVNAENEIADDVQGFVAEAQAALDSINEVLEEYNAGNLNGASAYDTAVSGGYTGTREEFNAIIASAQENVIECVKVNGTALSPVNKAVDIPVPQNTVSGSGITAISVLTQTQYDAITAPAETTLYIIKEE